MTLERLNSPLLVGRYTLLPSDIQASPWPSERRHRRDIVNEAEMRLLWDPAREKWEQVKVIIQDVDSQKDFRVRQKLAVEMKGLPNSYGTATEVSQLYGPSLLALFNRLYSRLRIGAHRRAWLFHPGDHVWVTLNRIVQGVEQPLYAQAPAIVVQAGSTLQGTGSGSLATLDLLLAPDRRLSYWCPSGEIQAYVAGPPPQITLFPNSFSAATQVVPWTGAPARDADFFADAMKVYVQNPGEEASRVTRTLSNRSGDTYDLDSALPVGMGANSVITFPGWADATGWQALFVYIADNGGTLGAGGDLGFQYAE